MKKQTWWALAAIMLLLSVALAHAGPTASSTSNDNIYASIQIDTGSAATATIAETDPTISAAMTGPLDKEQKVIVIDAQVTRGPAPPDVDVGRGSTPDMYIWTAAPPTDIGAAITINNLDSTRIVTDVGVRSSR